MFQAALEPYRGRLLVGCSGGADSVSLAHSLLSRSAEEASEPPLLLYVDHGLRSESRAEGQAVLALAQSFGAEAQVVRVEVPQQASLESAARDARYAALERAASEHRIDWILLGHTSSDQAETIFMRIVRGTGLVGLAGMPRQRGRIARPLLDHSRQDTEAYCHNLGIGFVEDAMNRDSKFTRARIRHHWLPQLRKENPRFGEALVRLGESARDHREVLDYAARRHIAEHCSPQGLLLNQELGELPSSLRLRVLALQAEEAGVPGLESRHLQAISNLALRESSGTTFLDLPGGQICRSYGRLTWDFAQAGTTWVELPEGYRARRWLAGDRMRPCKLKGRSKKLSDLFAELKIPKQIRSQAWVAVNEETGEIVWAEHVGAAFDCQVLVSLRREPDESAKQTAQR